MSGGEGARQAGTRLQAPTAQELARLHHALAGGLHAQEPERTLAAGHRAGRIEERAGLTLALRGRGAQHRNGRYQTVFEVDVDALALGTPNHERASLERWIALVCGGGDATSEDRARADAYAAEKRASTSGHPSVVLMRFSPHLTSVSRLRD